MVPADSLSYASPIRRTSIFVEPWSRPDITRKAHSTPSEPGCSTATHPPKIVVSQTGDLSEDTNTPTVLEDVPLLKVGSAYVLSLVFDPAVNFYKVIAFAGQQEIPADAAKAIEEVPQQRGGAANEHEAVTVMRDAIADPVDLFTVE